MTPENRELLSKDLCGRVPYEVIVCIDGTTNAKLASVSYWEEVEVQDGSRCLYDISDIKPYLFPLSSMTEEQYNSLHELGILDNCSHSYEYVNPHIHGVSFIFKQFKTYSLELIEWLNKNHFDYRGLIENGLAIDCTNLNIY